MERNHVSKKPEEVRLTLLGMSAEEIREYEMLIGLVDYEPSSDRSMGGKRKMELDIPIHR